jgi:hypothetical protein
MTKKELKEEWHKWLGENPRWKRTINNHHYIRTRYASKFFLSRLEKAVDTPSLKKTEAFLAFHKKHPEMRFFQCLLAFTGYAYIFADKGNGKLKDTFHIYDEE